MKRSDGISDLVEGFVTRLSDAILKEVRARADAAGRRSGRGARPSGRYLQGVYLGKLRKLRGRMRMQVRALARTRGVSAAVTLADRLLRVRE
jgi:hypothetical protein